MAPVGLLEGSIVFGFFADGAEGQLPIILGTLPGAPENISDIPYTAKGEFGVTKSPESGEYVTEPASAYKAHYPYNKSTHTESGHVFEVDDTPGEERLHTYHRTGTYTEAR
jgi:hypothetical protein